MSKLMMFDMSEILIKIHQLSNKKEEKKSRNDSEASNAKRPLFKIMNRKRHLHM